MVFDAILGFICSIPISFINSVTSVATLNIPQGTFDWWYNVFSVLTYVFPVWSLVPIFSISILLKLLQIAMALIHRIKGFVWASNQLIIQNEATHSYVARFELTIVIN